MIRKIIKIDKTRCNGCGLCVNACHEGAIGLENGKAKLLRDDYCDGLGDCLPTCPTGAITFENREAEAYDDEAVKAAKALKASKAAEKSEPLACGCPGTHSRTIVSEDASCSSPAGAPVNALSQPSRLRQWPVQIKLAPVNAPYFDGTHLLIAADCTAYAYGNFHEDFIRNKVTLIGCPKLDEGDYSEKLTAILKSNEIKSVTVVRMEVPCCGGIENAVKTALQNCGRMIPWQVAVISTDGQLLE